MAEPLKTAGLVELQKLRVRTNRQLTNGSISRPTHAKLIEKIDDLEAFIISMDEKITHRLRKRLV